MSDSSPPTISCRAHLRLLLLGLGLGLVPLPLGLSLAARAAEAPPPPPSPAPADAAATTQPAEQFRLTADVMQAQAPVVNARGNARLVHGEWTLTANEIQYNYDTAEAVATGDVLITRPGLRLLGETARYWTRDRRFEVENFRVGQPPYVMAGRRAHGTAEQMIGEQVEIHYGEPGPLTPRATAARLTILRDESFSAQALRFAVGRLPVFAFAGLSRSLAPPQLDWETRIGFDDTLGFQLGAGAYVPWRPLFRPGGSLDLYSKRGVMFGPGARYGLEEPVGDHFLSGAFDVAYISDSGDRNVDNLGRPIDKPRSFATWNHHQQAGPWTLNGTMNWWSDSDVTRDFRSRDFEYNQEPDNFLEAAWHGSNLIASAFVRVRPNDFQLAVERLPEVRVDLLPTPLRWLDLVVEGEASAVALREKPLGNNDAPGLRSDRLDAYVGLSRTFNVAKGTTLTPVVGGRWTHYLDATGGRDNYTRLLGEVGFDARMRAHRTWDLKRPWWGIDGIRHRVEPYLSYRYVPRADRGRGFIPVIDDPVFLPQMQPLGLAGRRDIDELGEIDVLRVGVANRIETRRADYGSRRVLHFDLGADFYLDDDHRGNRVPDVFAEMLLTPADWLEWWVYARVDPDEPWVNEFNSRFTIISGRKWSGGLGVDFLRSDLSQYLVFGRYALNEATEVMAAVRYDARESRVNRVEAGIAHRVHQNWQIGASVHQREGTRRESGFGLRFDLRFLPF